MLSPAAGPGVRVGEVVSDGSRASSRASSDGPDDAAATPPGVATPKSKPMMKWFSEPSLFDDIVIEGTDEGQRYKKLSKMLDCPPSGRLDWDSFTNIMRRLMGDRITVGDLRQEWADAGDGGMMTIGRLYTLLVSSDHYHVPGALDRLLEEYDHYHVPGTLDRLLEEYAEGAENAEYGEREEDAAEHAEYGEREDAEDDMSKVTED